MNGFLTFGWSLASNMNPYACYRSTDQICEVLLINWDEKLAEWSSRSE